MKSYCQNIANYIIRFESESDAIDLVPGERFSSFLSSNNNFDVLIKVHKSRYALPSEAIKVFDAPYVEEINGIRIKKSDKFWSVHKYNKDLFIKTVFPLSDEKKSAVLRFSLSDKSWDLYFDGADSMIDPFEYPLDGLVLYYLTVMNGDIMIHGSGVRHEERGYLFSGISGKGKTTMAKLWDQYGATVIHDDRLVIRKRFGEYTMSNTPVYKNDVPRSSSLDKIFLIEHGKANEFIPASGANAVSLVMSNCIQHNWNQDIIAQLISSVSLLCTSIPVYRLPFIPDKSIITEIIENEY